MKQRLTRLAILYVLFTLVLVAISLSADRVLAFERPESDRGTAMRATRGASLAAEAETLRPKPSPVRTPSAEDRTARRLSVTTTPGPKAMATPVPVPVPAPRR